ncbi:hypothetical protein [Maricaulis parjimensis]|uniref:hypothetical protein n=1 Tax=Maricaulis parjimensis TaxID=144023 RepID=UPI001939E10F|nr:hypothetical protein [Maricaulis parjimensis]
MLLKSLALMGLATSLVSLPVTLPVATGSPVTLAVGAVQLHYDRQSGLDVDFEASCLVQTCPFAEVRFDRAKPDDGEDTVDDQVRLIRV